MLKRINYSKPQSPDYKRNSSATEAPPTLIKSFAKKTNMHLKNNSCRTMHKYYQKIRQRDLCIKHHQIVFLTVLS